MKSLTEAQIREMLNKAYARGWKDKHNFEEYRNRFAIEDLREMQNFLNHIEKEKNEIFNKIIAEC